MKAGKSVCALIAPPRAGCDVSYAPVLACCVGCRVSPLALHYGGQLCSRQSDISGCLLRIMPALSNTVARPSPLAVFDLLPLVFCGGAAGWDCLVGGWLVVVCSCQPVDGAVVVCYSFSHCCRMSHTLMSGWLMWTAEGCWQRFP
jgi:hypothetical protein